jgi:hypothetical protein
VSRTVLLAGLAMLAATLPALADDPMIHVELNAAQSAAGKCRLSFVVENALATPVEALKLDLAIFGRDGAFQRRLLTEMGPVRVQKTVVRTFEIEGDCAGLGSVLVNDVTACAPAALGDCLEKLSVSSRVEGVRLFK